MSKRFRRADSTRYSKLGKKRRKLQKWRGAKGRHSKLRLNRKSYPKSPRIGFKTDKSKINKIKGLEPKLVYNSKEIALLDKNKNIVILSKRVGAKKKIEMISKAKEMGLQILNVSEEGK